MNLLVSIVITTFNRCEYLKRALTSALNQTYSNIEIIVVDDASTDDTSTFMEVMQTKHINVKYLLNAQNRGSNFCRNYGINQATGIFVAGLDSDDEFHPQRIEKLVMEYDDNYAFITSLNKRVVGSNVNYSACMPIVTMDDLLMINCLMNQGLIERDRMLSVGLYDESLNACQDYDIWIRLCDAFGNVKVVQEYLQTVYENDTVERISNRGFETFKGYWGFYRKYKNKLSVVQRQSFLFTIYRMRGKLLACWSFRALLSKHNENVLIKYYKKNDSGLCDYFTIQNVTNKITALDNGNSYILYGYGSLGKVAHLYLKGSIVAIVDEGLIQDGARSVLGIPIIGLQALSHNDDLNNLTVLITPINHATEIKQSLKSLNLNYIEII